MKILDILSETSIISELKGTTKKAVLEELIDAIRVQNPQLDRDRLMSVLLERERLGSTGIGEGVAIPHGKSKTVKRLLASFGRSVSGVDFQSMDGKPTHLFFLLVAAEESAGIHLKALARISRLMKDASVRKRLMEAETGDEMYAIFAEGDEKV